MRYSLHGDLGNWAGWRSLNLFRIYGVLRSLTRRAAKTHHLTQIGLKNAACPLIPTIPMQRDEFVRLLLVEANKSQPSVISHNSTLVRDGKHSLVI